MLTRFSFSAEKNPVSRGWLGLVGLVALAVVSYVALTGNSGALPRIGAITTVTELSSGLVLQARVDTGAMYCSIHCERIEIPAAGAEPSQNVGKDIRFQVKNSAGETAWIQAKLTDHSAIRTSTLTSNRYMVYLPLQVEGVTDTMLVTLNNRESMRYPFLVGRNLLRDRFVVDVRLNNNNDP